MGSWKKDLTPLLMHWSYIFLHQPIDLIYECTHFMLQKNQTGVTKLDGCSYSAIMQ